MTCSSQVIVPTKLLCLRTVIAFFTMFGIIETGHFNFLGRT